ncbi:hypothetical protein BMF94_6044 [Rhodotorula taiwanensis]|uniref:RING-type E3 ubiquitin transferase n=1 Tax=Rhodotorula taiwanensis TaxID=741276 RepID=A0A2S5B258_9BASI|nr:hypothetical protein BMF94_6044 [Rhodotorula taiwanensis]
MSAYPVDPGQAIRWTKCPGYTTRLLDLVHRLDPVDRTLLFTTKGKGKQSIVADITDGLFTTGPHPDHSRVEKQRASVQRRINQLGSIYTSAIRRLKADPYSVHDTLVETEFPYWDQLHDLLRNHPDYPKWSLEQAEDALDGYNEQDGELGRADMQDVRFDHSPIATASGSEPGSPPRRAAPRIAAAPPTNANAVAGPSNPKPPPPGRDEHLFWNPPPAAAAAAAGPSSGRFSAPSSSHFRLPYALRADSGSGVASGSGSGSGAAAPPAKRRRTASPPPLPPMSRILQGRFEQAMEVVQSMGAEEQAQFVLDRIRAGKAAEQLEDARAQQEEEEAQRQRQLAAMAGPSSPRLSSDEWTAEELAELDAAEARLTGTGVAHPLPNAGRAVQAPDPVGAVAFEQAVPAPQPEPVIEAPVAAAPVPADANHDDGDPPLAECPKCTFPLSAVTPLEAEEHLRSCLDSDGAVLAECPVCEMALGGLANSEERERHVDACCRGLGAGGGGTTSSTAGGAAGAEGAATRGIGGSGLEPRKQKREHVVFVSDAKTVPKDEKTGEALECIMCFDEFEAEQRLARLSCYCLFHEACIESYWENPSKFCPTHRDLDTVPEVQMRGA